MSRKRALIVDDSRSARLILTRRLKKHKIDVENVPSAEKALEFLATDRPDVVFLDHMMPGMDGLEALQAIKGNPRTATIPVLMYTSRSGDLYLGQARALGAVGVLPKSTRQVELAEVLHSLNLIESPSDGKGPRQRAVPGTGPGPGNAEVSGNADVPGNDDVPGNGEVPGSGEFAVGGEAEPALATAPLAASGWPEGGKNPLSVAQVSEQSDSEKRLREFFDRRLRGAQAEIRRELSIGLDRWGERFSASLGSRLESAGARLTELEGGIAAQSSRWPLSVIAIAAVIGLTMGLALGYFLGEWRAASNFRAAAVTATSPRGGGGDPAAGLAAGRVADPDREQVLQALEWAANQSGSFDFQTVPFDDARAELLTGLTMQLRETGFTGTLRLESHVGDFCMVSTNDGWELAPDSMPADDCDQRGWAPVEAEARSAEQSVQFANRLGALEDSGPVSIEIVALGNLVPLVSYPAAGAGVTAGEWNEAALRNNRVETYFVRNP
jgi:CheY-like chemotaxis protein